MASSFVRTLRARAKVLIEKSIGQGGLNRLKTLSINSRPSIWLCVLLLSIYLWQSLQVRER